MLFIRHIAFLLLFLVNFINCDGIVYRTNKCLSKTEVPDKKKRSTDFIEKQGFTAETHKYRTEDGYVLVMHRIPCRTTEDATSTYNKSVVLLQHGLLGASDNWLLGGRNSLPFYLADRGFDVWVSNSRGNSYSWEHLNFTSNTRKFWDFSFHEHGVYDLSATIDYILATTNQPKLFYLGHSRGTTMGYILLSTRPEYNDKVKLMISMAPVAFLNHIKSPAIQAVSRHTSVKQIESALRSARMYSMPGTSPTSLQLRSAMCGEQSSIKELCMHLLFMMNGFNYDLFNKTMLPVIMSHFPDGGSFKEVIHFLQLIKSGKFRQYDYGASKNMKKYGQSEPPEYQVKKITAPMAIYHADNDYLVSTKDMERLVQLLPNVVDIYRVPFKKFNHIDFIWGLRADQLLYSHIADSLIKYSTED